ncbi:MAG TPA: autotransporter domain-containing protein [Povalibacter sp.]|nr:autotransporter domain-containing protein [Povalibacter sp.]
MNKHSAGAQPLAKAVRRVLMASTLAPLCLLSSTALAQEVLPIADAGADRTVVDTDAQPGEDVALDGSASQPVRGTISSYVWTNSQGTQIATGPTPTVRLPDGVNPITLTITEELGSSSAALLSLTATTTVNVTVQPTSIPVANPGASRTIADTDGKPGEAVTLDGSGSTDLDGTIVSYQWLQGETTLGNGAVLSNVSLPDGENQITLVVTDNVGNTASASITLTIGTASPAPKPSLVNDSLKPNAQSVARNLDDLCTRLTDMSSAETLLTPEQSDLLARCDAIIGSNATEQANALDELGAQDLNAIRAQALVFSRTQHQGVMDRLLALRGGERGISVAGLSLSVDGRLIPAQQIAQSLKQLLGGGASSDADQPGGLLGNRLGLWLRGNYGTGDKDASPADRGFKSDQWGFTGGVDYRFGEAAVAGIAVGYGQSDLDFRPVGQGNLDTTSWSGSLYGSAYLGNFYFDGVFNYAGSDYDSQRRILYTEAGTTVDRTATGATRGKAVSGGLSMGYDFIVGGFTVSPTVGYFYVDTNINDFTEHGAAGLNLAYDEQNFQSATGNAGIRVSYAWKMPWGVLVPHLRGTYVREFEDATEVFGVRFASDPFASASNPTPPIIVRTDEPDTSYFRWAAGLSAQLPYDLSGYFEYQRLTSFQYVDFQDFTVGLRIQHAFR